MTWGARTRTGVHDVLRRFRDVDATLVRIEARSESVDEIEIDDVNLDDCERRHGALQTLEHVHAQ